MDTTKPEMQFIDLAAQQKRILPQLQKRITDVLLHGNYIMGPEVIELEQKLSDFTGAKHVISCSSGTDALLMVLMARGIGKGDAVFTTPFSFMATAEVIAFLGATPVFVDIDPITFNMNPSSLTKAIEAVLSGDSNVYPLPSNDKKRSRLNPGAIIPVDIFGLPADYVKINSIAEKAGLPVLEDAAQSFGSEYNGKKACNLSDVAATSFFPAKPLGCYGDGGAVFTSDDGFAEVIKSIRVHGRGTEKYDNIRIGINGRLDTIQAAILLEKLKIFTEEIRNRKKVADLYSALLLNKVDIQTVPKGSTSVWAQYSIRSDARDVLRNALKKNNIPTAVYYPKPLHLQTAFASLGYKPGDFPVSEELSNKIFSLPMHPYLTYEQIHHIAGVITKALI
ncbi:DegT/DnrJ/EryC1/StrS family aminotransferase [Desulfobacula phenolica]|uniref:dTDP-4-amino-4,6-dideoxygalactose transaminase n=1 Tax=Desulfobacula phenolica TaxID=90732 RepID=A0A1H2EP49_9BACT|nr:DegT/DnrJ/EryC1/StrS family aminotransferase [Desulfobacula phenolica]SDT96799.1 dTDP-4-amino-4,6-dideoxygalactose transaminase [Desulfobacula phenolica]